jgi:tetratricopeptide (TPR) repeat protein
MTNTTARHSEFRTFLRAVLFACAVLGGVPSHARNSYVYVVPSSTHNTHGGTVRIQWTDRLRYVKGEPGGTGLVSSQWKQQTPPSHIKRMGDGLLRELGIREGLMDWGDDLSTFIVVRVNLSPLVGNPSAGVLASGIVRSDELDSELSNLEARVALALDRAVTNLPNALKWSGINEEMWKVLTAEGKKNWNEEGVPYEVMIADDYASGHKPAWTSVQKLISSRQKVARDAKFMLEKIDEEARRRASRTATFRGQKPADLDPSLIGVYAEGDFHLPIAWYWRAWDRVDRNDYGPQTVALVERAERALQDWEKRKPASVPLLVTEREFQHFGGMTWDGDDLLSQHLELNRAYVHYLRGIVDENRAKAESDLARRTQLEVSAARAFEQWRDNYDRSPDDPIQYRAAGIAAAQGIRGFRRDSQQAVKWLETAAEMGSADALNWIGIIHDYYGAPKIDRVKARAAYERGIAQGSTFAHQNLAILHLFGAPGVPQSYSRYNELRIASGLDRLRAAWHAPLLPSNTEPVRNGNKLAVRVLGEAMPRTLVAHPSFDPVEGRDVQIEVDYTVASGVGQLDLDFSDTVIGGGQGMQVVQRKPVRVEGTGKETLWIGGTTTGYVVGTVKVRLHDASGQKELSSSSLPIALRWDIRQLPTANKERPAEKKLSKEQLDALNAEFQKGRELAAKADDAGAEKIFDAILERMPDSGPARVERAAARWNQQKQDAALSDLDEAIRLKTPGMHAHRLRGIFRVQKGDLAGALSDFNEAVRRDPKNAELLGFRGAVQSDLGKLELALADFNASLELNPEQPETVFQRARLHEARGDDTAAVADYSRAFQLDPKASGALNGRAWIRFRQQRWDSAVADTRQALGIDPEFASAARTLGYALFGSGDMTAAFDALTKAADLSKEGSDAVYPLLLRHIAARRLGRDDPRLAASWGHWGDDSWAQALAKFLTGRASEDELEKLVAATTEAEAAKGRRCEMNFYIGCARLLAGDKSTARLRFEAAVAAKADGFVEHVLAQAELKRL